MTRSLVPTDYRCTLLIGFSQTNQWWPDFRNTIASPSKWELLWGSGASIETWADAGNVAWSNTILNPVSDSQNPDRVVLNVSGGYEASIEYWRTNILAAVANIRARYPNVRMILLQSNVSGPGGALCPHADPSAVDDTVRCTWTNRYIRSAIAAVSRGNVREGGYAGVANCATDFEDYIGHLVTGARPAVGAAYAAYYNANL